MNLREIILNCQDHEEMSFVYAKKNNDKFQPNSEALILQLDESEIEISTIEIAKKKCPEFTYFLEMFLIQELFIDLKELKEYKSDEKKVERIIYYAENDA